MSKVEEKKAIKDAKSVMENAPDVETKREAGETLDTAERRRRGVKAYKIESLKTDPFAGVGVDKDARKEAESNFDKLSEEEKKKFVIRKRIEENRWLQKNEQHEVSLEDEQLINAAGPLPGPSS